MIKKLITISLIVFTFLVLMPVNQTNVVFAQQPPPTNNDDKNTGTGNSFADKGNQIICKGSRDFSTFMSATIGYDDFREYFKDLLVRYNTNMCQYQDIYGIIKRIDKAREQLRQAFYVCGNTQKLKETYYKLEAELFWARKYIDTTGGNFIQASPEKLKSELRSYFVFNKNYFSDSQIEQLYEQFKTKYDSKLKTYQNCKDPTWGNLIDKWNEFKDSILGIGDSLKEAKQSIAKKLTKLKNTTVSMAKSFTTKEGLMGHFLNVRINGLAPLEGLDQIFDELKKNAPEGISFDTVQAVKFGKDAMHADKSFEADALSEYQTLYMETSDEYSQDIVASLNELNKIINDTYPFQNQTIQCVKGTASKFCP